MKRLVVLCLVVAALIGLGILLKRPQPTSSAVLADPGASVNRGPQSPSGGSASEEPGGGFDLVRTPSQNPEGIRVEGFPYLMRSPHDPEGPMIDFTGLAPGMTIECPTTAKPIRVPMPTAEEHAIAKHKETIDGTKVDTAKVKAQKFGDAVSWLAEFTDVPIVIDHAKITEFSPKALDSQITLDLVNVPLSEFLNYVSQLSGVPHEITADGVLFTMNEPPPAPPKRNPNFFTKTYKRPAHLPKPGPDDSIMDMMRARGVDFPDGASVFYHAGNDALVIRNDKEQMQRMDAVIDGSDLGGPQEGTPSEIVPEFGSESPQG